MKRALLALVFVSALALSNQPVGSAARGSLELTDQTAYVPADGEFSAIFSWSGEVGPETTLVAKIHQPLTSSLSLDTPNNDILTQTTETSLKNLERTEAGDYRLEIPVRSFESDGPNDAFYLPEAGVHPVSIELFDSGLPIDSLSLFLIHLPEEATLIEPVPISIILPVSQAEGLTVRDAAEVLDRHPGLPIDLQVGAGVLSQLDNDPELTALLRLALRGRHVVISPRLDLDPSALAEINQGGLFTQSVEEARNRVRGLGLRPNSLVMPWDGEVTSQGASLIRGLGIETILIPPNSPLSSGRLASSNGGSLNVIEPDESLSARLSNNSNGAQDANYLLAEITLQTAEDPSPVVLGGPELADLDVAGLEILLSSLEEFGPLQPLSLAQAVSTSPSTSSRPSEQPQQDLRSIADSVNRIEAMIETYNSFYIADGPEPETYQASLLSALSRGRNPDDRTLRIDQITSDLDQTFGSIQVGEQQAFTLTSDRFAVPLSISSGQPGPRMVMLRFQSDKIKVYADESYSNTQDMLIRLAPGDTTLTINLESRALGLSPVDVIVLTPDGQRQLAAGQFTVRSTAIPGLGILMSGAAFVFLLVWWFRHHRKESSVHDSEPNSNSTVSV